MADLKKHFGTSVQKELDGVWSGNLGGGLRLKTARINNPRFRKLWNKKTKGLERQIRNKKGI